MSKIMYILFFISFLISNDKSHTLTEFDIQTIDTFSETGFSSFSDYIVINNLMNSDFHSKDSEIHFAMYHMCLTNDNLGCANKHLNRAIQINGKQTYYDLSDSLSLYRDFLENARRAVSYTHLTLPTTPYV